ncbi:SIR2 family NAD-dependent protein deacylase [Arenibacter algicola]|uniref:SIR2-like domain protein n=1 Tax=Arenibacter algicola TaxID=616991 RepID=A0A221V1Q0_9FLAO|nr:SIR2 family protein [Arenibacter algicola]ASO07519.1 SIR2-like domain protein [Arenibacter algicola]
MFTDQDEKYLTRLIGRNEVILFLGAGFSLGAKNKLDERFPTGKKLGKKLWDFLGYDGDYDDDDASLPLLYQDFTDAGIKRTLKTDFLNNNLLSAEIPENYNSICKPFWRKIYTINIDDVVQKVYSRNGKKLMELVFPKDEFKERDQSLEYTSIIHLHGKLPCDPEDIVFSTKQYAKANLTDQPLYSQFVYDYATRPTIFVGTDLNEPIFERYIEARENKAGYGESRPKSFLITPWLSQVKKRVLKNSYNVHHIEGTSDDFFNWLNKIDSELPTKEELLKSTFPSLLDITEFIGENVSKKSIYNFSSSFKRVPTDYNVKDKRSAYLLGANPTWNDIHSNLDIPRTITNEIYADIYKYSIDKTENRAQKIVSLSGTAGSGKSTIIRRLGLRLSRNGITVFITDSDTLAKPHQIFDVLEAINETVVLIFDNSALMMHQIDGLLTQFAQLKFPPIILLSTRTNQVNRLVSMIDTNVIDFTHYRTPNLDDDEIKLLISKLDDNNLLSRLKGMSDPQRFREFKNRAKKQILIAMKEATNGMPFNKIIENEFEEINPLEAKILCICIALNTELGFYNTKQDFVGFSKVSHNESLNFLQNTLAGTLLSIGENDERFMIRHRILADFMIKHCADISILKEAYIRVLSVLAPELVNSNTYNRKFNLYKSLINHKILYYRFRENIELAREVYDSLVPHFEYDAHFWLQYGSLEIEGKGGDLNLAESYINSAESLAPNSDYIQNAKCSLYYKLSTSQNSLTVAMEYKNRADELSTDLINRIGDKEPYIYHIHCRGRYYFIQKWVNDRDEKVEKLNELRKILTIAGTKHPRDKKLDQALQAINRAYMNLGTNISDLEQPDIL